MCIIAFLDLIVAEVKRSFESEGLEELEVESAGDADEGVDKKAQIQEQDVLRFCIAYVAENIEVEEKKRED